MEGHEDFPSKNVGYIAIFIISSLEYLYLNYDTGQTIFRICLILTIDYSPVLWAIETL